MARAPKAIGTMRSFWSNFAHMVRALAYTYANGAEGLTAVSHLTVLNATTSGPAFTT